MLRLNETADRSKLIAGLALLYLYKQSFSGERPKAQGPSCFKICLVLFCLKIFLTLTNSEHPDEMQHYAAFHLGLHFFAKVLK